jgi:hypothetical protein
MSHDFIMKKHTGIIKDHKLHTRCGGSLWRALPALALAALFGSSTSFAGTTIESVKDGFWSDSAILRYMEGVIRRVRFGP